MATKRPKKRNKQTVAAQRARYKKEQEELAAQKSGKKKRSAKEIAVIIISVIVALGLMLPSLAQIFAQPSTSESIPTTVEGFQERYQPLVDELQGELAADPTNQDAQLELANTYFQWGSYAQMFAGTEDFQAEVERVFGEAKNAYAAYLELVGNTDSEEAKQAAVSEALCDYYTGNSAQAITSLEDLAEKTDFASAWANLGMIYASQGSTDQAIECYEKGAAADPDDALGVKSYCEQQIESLQNPPESAEVTVDEDDAGDDSAAGDGSSTTDGSDAETGEGENS